VSGPVPARRSQSAGSVLVEVLIAMSIMTIGVLGIVAGGRVVREQAELAARRAAEALAAQQVLEQGLVGAPGDSSRIDIDTVVIGVHRVRVRVESKDSARGLTWVRVQADADAGGVPWEIETLRRFP
jgi:Flp pilus assembly protein TadG